MSDRLIGAIDIGTTKIVAVVAKIENDKSFRILSYAVSPSKGMKNGRIVDYNSVVKSIEAAVDQSKMKTEYGITEVYVGIAGQMVRGTRNSTYKFLQQGYVTEDVIMQMKNEMYNSATDDSEQVMHVIERGYKVDEQEYHNPLGIEGKKIEADFHLIIADKSFINIVRRSVKDVGLQVKKCIFEPLASAEAVLTPEEWEAGVILIDIGGGTTDLVVVKEGQILHSSVIPFGGESITNDIKNALKILKNDAERIKIDKGKAIAVKSLENDIITVDGIAGRDSSQISSKDLALIIQARVLEIVDTVIEQIKDYYDDISAGITLTGGGALLQQIDLFFRFRSGLDVRLASPDIPDIPELAKPQFSTTIGLLKKGIVYELREAKEPAKSKKAPVIDRPFKKSTDAGKGFIDRILSLLTGGPDDDDI